MMLTEKEAEVLQSAAEGLTTQGTAKKMFLSPETIKSHRQHILSKLGALNIAHATAIGVRDGLID